MYLHSSMGDGRPLATRTGRGTRRWAGDRAFPEPADAHIAVSARMEVRSIVACEQPLTRAEILGSQTYPRSNRITGMVCSSRRA
jgi:hypothetical protein